MRSLAASEVHMHVIRLLVVLFICAAPVMADNIFDVTGALTIVGNNTCSGTLCVETLSFSFQFAYQLVPQFSTAGHDYYVGTVLPGGAVTSFGPLAQFFMTTGYCCNSSADYIPFFNLANDEIDIFPYVSSMSQLTQSGVSPAPPVFVNGAELYGCGVPRVTTVDATCIQDFSTGVVFGGVDSRSSALFTVTAAPEGSVISYLLVGVGLGLLGMLARTQKYC
jgi:hypothetical protein